MLKKTKTKNISRKNNYFLNKIYMYTLLYCVNNEYFVGKIYTVVESNVALRISYIFNPRPHFKVALD